MITYTKIPTENLKVSKKVFFILKDFGVSENHLILLRKNMENILVNNAPSTMRATVSKQDNLLINANPGQKTTIKPIDSPLDIVFEDEHVLLVNKPSGISSMPNRSHYDNNLAGQIVHHCSKQNPNFILRIVNRLDKDTQGLILVAKTLLVYKTVFETSKKTYHAVLSGSIEKPLEIYSPILEIVDQGRIALKRIISDEGKPASTFITPIQQFKKHTLCQIEIVHGRTHQIRVHTSSVGHGIEGDYVYNKKSDLIPHTALVCKKLSFYHPVLKQQLTFEVDYEKAFINMLKQI